MCTHLRAQQHNQLHNWTTGLHANQTYWIEKVIQNTQNFKKKGRDQLFMLFLSKFDLNENINVLRTTPVLCSYLKTGTKTTNSVNYFNFQNTQTFPMTSSIVTFHNTHRNATYAILIAIIYVLFGKADHYACREGKWLPDLCFLHHTLSLQPSSYQSSFHLVSWQQTSQTLLLVPWPPTSH